jgi:DnaJ family protein C protein 7
VGEAEQAIYHYKHSGAYADSEDIAQAQALQKHLSGCNEARKLKEWYTLLKNTQGAISYCADSAPQVLISYSFYYLPPLIMFLPLTIL